MSSRNPFFVGSLQPTADIAANRFVRLDGTQSVAGSYSCGISHFKGTANQIPLIPYTQLGNEIVETGGAFALGDELQSDSLGRAVKASGTAQKSAVIAGGAAGNLTVTGITTSDILISVFKIPGAGTAVTDFIDLTSQFTITAPNTINNTGGTTTASSSVLVTYRSSGSGRSLARAMQASTGAGSFVEVYLIPN